MALLDLVQVLRKMLQLWRRRHLQRKTKLGIQLPEGPAQHGLDLGSRGLRFVQGASQLVKGLDVYLLDAELEPFLLQRLGQLGQLCLEGLGAQLLEHITQQLEMNRANRLNLGGTEVEFTLLLLNAMAHGFDHRCILTPQAAKLCHLVIKVPPPNVDDTRRFSAQARHARGHSSAQYGLAPAHDAFGQGLLQRGQSTGFQQYVIRGDLGDQALLGRYRHHTIQGHTQHLRRGSALPLHLRLDLLGGVERVPERIDLVQHHQTRFHALW